MTETPTQTETRAARAPLDLKAVLALVAAAAIAVGFVLPGPHVSKAAGHSQFQTLELQHG
ncbi:hypothetical protein [Phenylobacterium sp.]|uniref:hypothetical protein n=1 Tax=Phenylobacterium sp. TaxID=1871053 RepID=UPI00120E1908|nr:hypothetical protein [Phenylobacterium sp.]THD58264.1 MAG: hypothetical protein E8A49_19980 [Phenylobacterium sp.]